MQCIAADLGGTFLRCALVGDDGALRGLQRTRIAGDALSRSDEIWVVLLDAIAEYAAQMASFLLPGDPLVFAFPGPVVDGRRPSSAPTVWGDGRAVPDLRRLLAERTARAVFMLNDVSAAAWYFSERLDADRFAVVTISSGVGAKLFDRSRDPAVIDEASYAGEIGHIVVCGDDDAPLCDCGGRGHLGALASGRGIERLARRAAMNDPVAFADSLCVKRFGATPETLTNEAHLVPAAAEEDSWTLEILRRAARPLAGVLCALAVGNGLERIAIVGGFAQQIGPPYLRILREAFAQTLDRGPALMELDTLFFLASADEYPSLLGAAAYVRRTLEHVC